MGVIVDTSIWIDVERGRLALGDLAVITGDEPVYLAPPVLAEFQYGVERARTPAQRLKRAAILARLRRKPCLIMDAETGAVFGRLSAALDKSGRPYKHRVQDVWIAALAIQHHLKVLTRNPKDFTGIPGLEVLPVS